MALPRNRSWSPDEYLTFDRESEFRHELIDGEIYAMTGASREHNLINTNFSRLLGNQLMNESCEIYASNMRVKTHATNYSYPDIVIVCGKAEFEDNQTDTLLNPVIVFEILSPSTERYDRGAKFQRYRTLTSLQSYILISQDAPCFEIYTRQGEVWVLSEAVEVTDTVTLAPINCTLTLADVYWRVL